jgi:hypothetical protein
MPYFVHNLNRVKPCAILPMYAERLCGWQRSILRIACCRFPGSDARKLPSSTNNLLGWVLPALVICAVEVHPVTPFELSRYRGRCYAVGKGSASIHGRSILACGENRCRIISVDRRKLYYQARKLRFEWAGSTETPFKIHTCRVRRKRSGLTSNGPIENASSWKRPGGSVAAFPIEILRISSTTRVGLTSLLRTNSKWIHSSAHSRLINTHSRCRKPGLEERPLSAPRSRSHKRAKVPPHRHHRQNTS